MSQYSIPLHETYVRMVLLTIFLGGFVLYWIYNWCYEMLPWIFPSCWSLWVNIFGYGVYPPITLYGLMITFITAGFRSLIPLFVILGSYLSNPLPSDVRSTMIPLDQYSLNVYSVVKDTASSLGLRMPQCSVLESTEPEAWTLGRSNRNAKLILTSGLLKLDKPEIKAVVTHELSHILNKDMAFVTWANNFVKSSKYWFPVLCAYVVLENALLKGALVFPGLDQLTFLSFNLLFLIVIPLPLINSLSRVREFLANAKAVLILKNPKLMVRTLEKIEKMLAKAELEKLLLSSRLSLVSSSTFSKNCVLNYLTATHPSTESRSTAIECRTYFKARTLTYETCVWIAIIAAGLTNLLDEFLIIFVQRTHVFGGFTLTSDYFRLAAALQWLLPSVLIGILLIFGVKGRSFPRSPSHSRLLDETIHSPLVFYVRQMWKKIIVSVTVFNAIRFAWYNFFSPYIMFEPFPFWELPHLFGIPELFFESWIAVLGLLFLFLMVALEIFKLIGFIKQDDKTSSHQS